MRGRIRAVTGDEEPPAKPERPRRPRSRPVSRDQPDAAESPAPEADSPAASAPGPEPPPPRTEEPADLPATPHPAFLPARPGTPPPPPGPPGSYPVPAARPPRSVFQLTAGVVLVALGVLALLSEFGLLWWVDGRLIWPVVLIGAGVFLVLRRARR